MSAGSGSGSVVAFITVAVILAGGAAAVIINKKKKAAKGYRIPISEIDEEDLEDFQTVKNMKW